MHKQITKTKRSFKKFVKKYQRVFKAFIGIVLVALGLTFLYMPLPSSRAEASIEPIVADKNYDSKVGESNIKRVIIPKIDIDVSVKPSKIVKGYWQTSETSASHGEGSANPGDEDNIVVFAHARENYFYNLKDIKEDDVIYVLTNEDWHGYKVREIKTVYPNQIETVSPTGKEVLTLFTCSGFMDEKRLIVKAFPIN